MDATCWPRLNTMLDDVGLSLSLLKIFVHDVGLIRLQALRTITTTPPSPPLPPPLWQLTVLLTYKSSLWGRLFEARLAQLNGR